MKTRLSLFFVLLFVLCSGNKAWSAGPEYCTPVMKSNMVGYIEKVTTTGASVNLNFVDPDAKTDVGGAHYLTVANKVVDSSMKVLPGQTINLTTNAKFARWGEIHLFLDVNADGEFAVSEKFAHFGNTDNAGKPNNEEVLSGDQTAEFTVPADATPGVIRMRMIIAGGTYADTGNNGCSDLTGEEGAFYDFEIEVQSATIPSVTYAVTFSAAQNGTFLIKNGENTIASGDEILENTTLTVETTPAEGYLLDVIKINGTAIENKAFTVTEVAAVEVLFKKEPEASSLTAIRVPTINGDNKFQFRFDDALLGEHKNGDNTGDKRARSFTMSAWVKTISSTGDIFGHAQGIMYGATGTFAAVVKEGKLGIKFRSWISGGDCPGAADAISAVTLNKDEWAFVTIVVNDATRKITLYKNGEQAVEASIPNNGIGLLADECTFFCGNGGYTGDFDEVQVWNKALEASEIKAAMGSYQKAPEGLIYHYRFTQIESDLQFANRGTGGACLASLVSGTTKYDPAIWADRYTYAAIAPVMVQGHVILKYALTYASETTGGSFVVKNGENVIASGEQLNEGTSLTVVATPADGYQVKVIQVNGEAIEGNTFNLMGDATVTVEFSNKLLLNYTYNETGGEVVVKSGNDVIANEGEFVKNGPITITVSPKEGYEIKTFTVNGEDKKSALAENSYSIANCNENLTVVVEFVIKTFTITYATPDNGSIQVKVGTRTINSGSTLDYGTELTVKLVPSTVSTLTSFTINGVEKKAELDKDNKMTITVAENLTLAATFKDATYKIVYTNTTPKFGTVVAKNYDDDADIASNSDVTKGSYVMIVCTPKEADQTVLSLKNNGVAVDLENDVNIEITDNVVTYIIDMQEDMTIEVAFSTPVGVNKQNAALVAHYDAKAQTLNIQENASAVIYNLAGNAVLSSSERMIDVSSLSTGYYLVKVSAAGSMKTVKFIKK